MHNIPSLLGLDRYRAGARYLIPGTIGRSYTNTDTGLYKCFALKMQFCARYRCVQIIYVCGVYARKYDIGLKL